MRRVKNCVGGRKILDWELSQSIAHLMLKCDSLSIAERCERIRAAGHEPHFVLGLKDDVVAKLMSWLLSDNPMARLRLFGVSRRVRIALKERSAELKRRMAAARRGLRSKYIYSSLMREPNGGQGYIVFRCSRSNRCIVYMLEWTSPDEPIVEDELTQLLEIEMKPISAPKRIS